LIFEHPPRKQSRCGGEIGGYPKSYARDGIPKIERYPGGQSAPTPEHIDFKPGELLGSVSGELGLRAFIKPILPS
jgi:formate dehydrogenase